MKNIILFSFAVVLASCNCSAPAADDSKATEAVIQADKDFNDYCAKHGQQAAFLYYADSSQISFGENALPTIGIVALKESLDKNHDTISRLTWAPYRGEASGDVGYTFGFWKYTTKTKAGTDTIYHGNYVTVWKKEKDGTWKYVVDGGTDTPAPKS
jgi:ketosteroid isomerase-like protein